MENILSKLSLNSNSSVNLEGDKFKKVLKISYKSDFPGLKIATEDGSDENITCKNYSLNVLYTGGIKTYVNNSSKENGYTTDIGWGCMIRSTQTLLANALRILWEESENKYIKDEEKLVEICSVFKDEYKYPLSIHNITYLGKTMYNVNVGDWFGPSIASQCIQTILKNCENKLVKSLISECLVTIDSGNIYEDEVERAINEKHNENSSVLILLCVRLGIDKINDKFFVSLLDLFNRNFLGNTNNCNFVGIAGGKPFKSLYFFDVDDLSNLIYVDPHFVTSYKTLENDDEQLLQDFQDNAKLNFTTVQELDPSMCIGFTIKSLDGLRSLKSLLKNNEIIKFENKAKELELLESLSLEDCVP